MKTKKSKGPPVAPLATGGAVAPRLAPIVRNDFVWTRLRVGDVFLLEGQRHVAVMVSECRARCIPLAKKRVDYETVSGKRVKFDTEYAAANISPNSEVKILERLGPDWRKKISIEESQSLQTKQSNTHDE